MNPQEYANLDRLDALHWFYRGKRAIVAHWIDRYRPLAGPDLLVDAGTGTGIWPTEAARRYGCRVIGVDDHDESLAIAGPRLDDVGGRLVRSNLEQIQLADGEASVVTALDVLEHLDDDRAALLELVRITRPGGLIVLTVPALRWLWSDWDEILHHRRRYHRGDLLRLLDVPDVELLRCAYFNSLLLPALALVRLGRKLVPARADGDRAENRLPSPPMNRLLYRLFVGPACAPWFHPPAGSSLLAVLRKVGG